MDEGLRERLLDEKEQGTADSRAGAEDGLNPETSVDDWDEAEDGRPKRSSLDGDQVELDTLGDTPMDGSSGVPWNLVCWIVLLLVSILQAWSSVLIVPAAGSDFCHGTRCDCRDNMGRRD